MPLFLLSVLLLLTGSYGHLQLKTAITTAPNSTTSAAASSEGDSSRIVTCPNPSSVLLIRSAYYLTSPAHNAPPRRHARSGRCHGGQCPPAQAIFRRGERMTSDDVMKVYRHCQGGLGGGCDVARAGVDEEFEMSYFCLEGPFIDPCANHSSETNASLLFNYSRHTTDCDVTCHCNVTSLTTSNTSSLVIRALNLFQNDAEEEEEEDGVDRKRFPEGCNHTTEQPGPRVQIETPDRRWEVKRRAVPVQWQLKDGESSLLSLHFHWMHGVRFGRLWMELEGREMHISCGATVQPEAPLPETSLPPQTTLVPRQSSYKSGQLLTYIVVAVAVTVGLMLAVVMAIAVAKWKRRRSQPRRARTKARVSPLQNDDDKQPSNNNGAADLIPLEGDYCTISDVTSVSSSSCNPHHVTRSQSRDQSQQPISDEEEEEERETTFSDVSRSDGGDTVVAMATNRAESVVTGSEYGVLNHGPSGHRPHSPRSDRVIYDHTGPFGHYGEGSEYHCLRHGVSPEPRVIDNVYDTMTNVAADS